MSHSGRLFPLLKIHSLIINFILVILLMTSQSLKCRKSAGCCLEDLKITTIPSNFEISAGSSEIITVYIEAATTDCPANLISTTKYNVGVSSTAPEDISGSTCSGDLDSDHKASCNMTISVPTSALQGTYEVQLFGQADYQDQNIIDGVNIYVTVKANQGDFTFSTPPSMDMLQAYEFYTTPVTIERLNGHDADIRLSIENIPLETYLTFDPSWLIGTASETILRGQSYAFGPLGIHPVILKANDGYVEKTLEFSLNILEPYSILFSQSTITINPGDTGTVDITVNRHETFYEDVDLYIYGVIIGTSSNAVDASFSIDPLVYPESSCVLILPVGEDVLPGVYSLLPFGIAGSAQKSYELELIIGQ